MSRVTALLVFLTLWLVMTPVALTALGLLTFGGVAVMTLVSALVAGLMVFCLRMDMRLRAEDRRSPNAGLAILRSASGVRPLRVPLRVAKPAAARPARSGGYPSNLLVRPVAAKADQPADAVLISNR